MKHMEGLLAVADRPGKVVDLLFTEAPKGSTSQWDTLDMQVAPSTAVALNIARSGGVRKAVAALGVLTDGEAIQQYVRKDQRRGVHRAAVQNPNTPDTALEYLLRAAVKEGDSEVALAALKRLPAMTALALLEEYGERFAASTVSLEVAARIVAEKASSDELRKLLVSPVSSVAVSALAQMLFTGDTEMDIDEVLDMCRVEPRAKAELLWTTRGQRHRRHLDVIFEHAEYMDRHRPYGQWTDHESLLALATHEQVKFREYAASAGILNDDIVAALVTNPSESVIEQLVEHVTEPRHAEVVAQAAIALRAVYERPQSARYYSRRGVPVENAVRLVAKDLVSDETALDILRTQELATTAEWLLGDGYTPKPGMFAQLLNDPGLAFASVMQSEPVVGLDAHTALVRHIKLDKVSDSPVSEEVFENLRGLVKYWATCATTLPRVSKYLLDRLYEAFGEEDTRLWSMWGVLAPQHVGTIHESIVTVAATYGVPLRTPTPDTPAVEGTFKQGNLF
jgi:hypothetical protein